jgi:hypothetical protein
MKKLLAIIGCIFYVVTSSALVHSFCLQEFHHDVLLHTEFHQEEDHGCCDSSEKEKNCYENCLSDINDITYPAKMGQKKISLLHTLLVTPIAPPRIEKTYTMHMSFDPPDKHINWCYVHIGTTQKIE